MTSSARADIFSKLRKAGAGLSGERIARELEDIGNAAVTAPPESELCEAFIIKVLGNGGSADCAGNRPDAVKTVAKYLYENFRSLRLVAGSDARLAAMPWRDGGVLPRFGCVTEGEPVALSYAQWGVVETGAVIIKSGKGNPGANHLLPTHHIVLVDAADLLATQEQAWEYIHQDMHSNGRPRGINFIAGPSSTADIEGQLIHGAHGPRYWHVILLGDVPAAVRARINRCRIKA